MIRTTRAIDHDVIVVGGGPAGSACAAHLAAAGVSVVVLDRSAFPREQGVRRLRRAGGARRGSRRSASPTSRGAPAPTRSVTPRWHLDGKPLIVRQLPALDGLASDGWTIPRLTLDGWVRAEARRVGATVVERAKATAVERDADWVTVRADIEGRPAQWLGKPVVSADGFSSLIARTLRGGALPKDDRIMGGADLRRRHHRAAGPGRPALQR
ncbi:MAG: FAD-dependent oxidoreductase [Ilumatobacteraceae bacterium]